MSADDQTDPQYAELVAAGWKRRVLPGFMQKAGPLWLRLDDGVRVFGLLTGTDHVNPAGLVHGGVLTTLADHAVSLCAWEAAGRVPCVTVQLDTHFLAPVMPGDFIEARPGVVRRGGSLVFVRASLSVRSAEVAVAMAVIKLLKA